jgi:hypothetical protein
LLHISSIISEQAYIESSIIADRDALQWRNNVKSWIDLVSHPWPLIFRLPSCFSVASPPSDCRLHGYGGSMSPKSKPLYDRLLQCWNHGRSNGGRGVVHHDSQDYGACILAIHFYWTRHRTHGIHASFIHPATAAPIYATTSARGNSVRAMT